MRNIRHADSNTKHAYSMRETGFRRTDFGSRLLAAEGEGAENRCG